MALLPSPMAVRTIATADGMFEPMRRAVNTSGPGTASRKMASGIHKAHDKP